MAADSPAAPALRQAVRARSRIKISDAKRALEQPAEVQEAALARLESGAAKTLGRAVSQVNSERAEAAARGRGRPTARSRWTKPSPCTGRRWPT